MKVGNLLSLMNCADDVLEAFDDVETKDQLVSRLDTMKRRPDELLEVIEHLRLASADMREDVLEIGPTLGIPEDLTGEDLDDVDALLKSVGRNDAPEEQGEAAKNPEKNEEAPVQNT